MSNPRGINQFSKGAKGAGTFKQGSKSRNSSVPMPHKGRHVMRASGGVGQRKRVVVKKRSR